MTKRNSKATELDVAILLDHRFGDGMVYLVHADERRLLKHAISAGLVSPEGFLTASGYRFWRRMDPVGALAGSG